MSPFLRLQEWSKVVTMIQTSPSSALSEYLQHNAHRCLKLQLSTILLRDDIIGVNEAEPQLWSMMVASSAS